MSVDVAELGRNLARAAVGREVLVAAVEALAEHDVPLVPLKGVYLQARVYECPEQRPIRDVDVLVPEHRFDAARERLVAAGWRWQAVNASEATATSPAHALPLDVHRRLFAPGAFDLATVDVFARTRPDRTRFGVEVWMPDPLDVLAHLVGHFVKSRSGPEDHVHLRDFAELARAHALAPVACARHLERAGLARAARYALGLAAQSSPDPFARDVLGALRGDPVGTTLASLARRARTQVPRGSALAALPGYLLEPSLVRGVSSLWRRVRPTPSAFSGLLWL